MRHVLDTSVSPVLFSHSNAQAICDHPRNVPDDVLDRVKANRGIVMATFVAPFSSSDYTDAMDQARPPPIRRRRLSSTELSSCGTCCACCGR
jgi:microsomal dipeptidase-like Zn-dependent dipeptidase